MPVEVFGCWTNKGGVGKTTLTFHLSALYAHLNPTKRVIIADMCPQANLSNTVLTRPGRKGSRVVRELSQAAAPLHLPKTVAGYLHTTLVPHSMMGKTIKKSDFLVKIDEHNPRMPENTWLLCGDNRLDEMSQALARAMAAPSGGMPGADNFKLSLMTLRFFFMDLETEWAGEDIVVFIDTNPAFTEYTQLALCTIDRLLIPVNADDFSLQAVDYMIWNLFSEQDEFIQGYMQDSFSVKASQRAADILPKIALIVHNRHSVRRTRLANAVQHLNNQQTLRACTALQGAKQRLTVNPSASPVYVDKGLPNASQFADIFTGTMREMFSAGVASAFTGIPMHRVQRNRTIINNAFDGAVVVNTAAVRNLLKDLVKLLALATDDPRLENVDEERVISLVAGAASLQGVLHQLDLSTVAVAYDRAREAAARGWADHEAEPVLDVDSDATLSDRAVPGGVGDNDSDDGSDDADTGAPGNGGSLGAPGAGASTAGGCAGSSNNIVSLRGKSQSTSSRGRS
ncbi:ATPase [Micractinium conductrix]|uniref:ATPase n=1 Tax=Micractinium conductrix TaxID=554055 RepID=A0A2P6VBB2_9CHLO|nr:ATPase [Micractinium conductrix]|eukprot:PSC71382.1 ATPase [Micractinium conductrix]